MEYLQNKYNEMLKCKFIQNVSAEVSDEIVFYLLKELLNSYTRAAGQK